MNVATDSPPNAAPEAIKLITAGLRVWPVRDKRPTRAGFARKNGPNTCATPAEFAAPDVDVAVLCGPCAFAGPNHRLVLLDLDGDVPADALPEWPATLTSKRGRHRWYLVPLRSKAWRQTAGVRSGDGWAVDTRDFGGYGQETKGAVPLWDNWGARPAELSDAQCAELFQATGGAHAQALVLAKTAPAAVQGQRGSDALWNVSLDLVRGLRVPPAEALALLRTHYNPRCQPPWSEAELHHKVFDAFERAEVPFGYLASRAPAGGYLTTAKGDVKACFENYVRYVRATYPGLRWDEVALAVYDGAARVDLDALSGHVRSGAAVAVGLDPSKNSAIDALVHVARERPFNHIRDMLEALPRWDGRRRLDRWLVAFLGASDTEYHRAVGRAWLVSAMARAFEPGCKADHLLLLEGAQGVGKSTALATLGGRGLYKDLTFSSHDKDAMQDLRGAWVAEYSELSGLSRRDDEWLKGHIARATDTYRASYGREAQDHPRTCVLAGTTNPQGDGRYLRDAENRRYWPVACEAPATTVVARMRALAEARDQLLAEALAGYRSGEVWYLDRDVGQAEAQEARREVDPLETSVPLVIGDECEVDMRQLRCDPRLVRDLPSSAVGAAKALAKVFRRLGFRPPTNHGSTVWRRTKPGQ
jgi:hypothetical protein